MRCYKDVICIVSQKKTYDSQTSKRCCWDRWDSSNPWAHLQACHMPGSVLSVISPRDDFISLQYNWRNRSGNWQLLGYADYYTGRKLQIPRGTQGYYEGTGRAFRSEGRFPRAKWSNSMRKAWELCSQREQNMQRHRGACPIISSWFGRSVPFCA